MISKLTKIEDFEKANRSVLKAQQTKVNKIQQMIEALDKKV